MYDLTLNTTEQRELYERACRRMAQLIPGWSDAIPSDPAVALLELVSYLSDLQNRELDRFREPHYLAYLRLLGEAPRRLAPARLLAVPERGKPWPGMRFEIDGVPFETVEVPEDGPVRLEQRRTRSQCLELDPPYPLPESWAGRLTLRFFRSEGSGWREIGGREGADGRQIRVVAAEPDYKNVYLLRELPSEEIVLEENGVLGGSLRLMVEENGLWYDCPICQPQAGQTWPRGCQWEEGRQTLRFGDGRDFRIPREGKLLVAGCACSLGAAGNGAGGRLEGEGVSLCSIGRAEGGQDGEDGKTAFFRLAKEQEAPLRAVSLADYESIALSTPGLTLDQVRVIPFARLGREGPGVVVIAKPRSPDPLPVLTRQQAQRVAAWLEDFRLIGVPVEVRSPRYCSVEVRARILVNGSVSEMSLRETALRYTDGVTGPLDFGAELSRTTLFAALGGAPGVEHVDELELRVLSGSGRRTREGGIALDEDTLPHMERFRLIQE